MDALFEKKGIPKPESLRIVSIDYLLNGNLFPELATENHTRVGGIAETASRHLFGCSP